MSKKYTLGDLALAAVTQALAPATLHASSLAAMLDMSSGQPVQRPFDQFFTDLVNTSQMRIQFSLRRPGATGPWEIGFTLFVNSFSSESQRTSFLDGLNAYAIERGLPQIEHTYEGHLGNGGRLWVRLYADDIVAPAPAVAI